MATYRFEPAPCEVAYDELIERADNGQLPAACPLEDGRMAVIGLPLDAESLAWHPLPQYRAIMSLLLIADFRKVGLPPLKGD